MDKKLKNTSCHSSASNLFTSLEFGKQKKSSRLQNLAPMLKVLFSTLPIFGHNTRNVLSPGIFFAPVNHLVTFRELKILPLGKKSLVDEKTLHLIFHESPMEDGALFGHN